MNEVSLISYSDLSQMAVTMSKSGMFGKNPDQLLSLMLIAQAEGIHPAIAAMEYDIIQGRPALKGQAALARFQQSGGRIDWLVRTDAEAKAKFTHPQGGELVVSWTMDRARKMGLDGKDNWKKQPGVMLSWRTVAEGVRAVFPACLNRMYLSEEVQDFEPMKNVTPAPEQVVQIAASAEPATNDGTTESAGDYWKRRASDLTKKAGLNESEKIALFKDCNSDIKAYCAKIEDMLSEPAPVPADPVAAEGDDGFALTSDPPVSMEDIVLDLEGYQQSEKTPAAAKKEIAAALANPSDLKSLVALLEKTKAACR